jgi:hypothetical protein
MAVNITAMEFERIINLVRAFGWVEESRKTVGKVLTLTLTKTLEGEAATAAEKGTVTPT